jgi:hypothetical protein
MEPKYKKVTIIIEDDKQINTLEFWKVKEELFNAINEPELSTSMLKEPWIIRTLPRLVHMEFTFDVLTDEERRSIYFIKSEVKGEEKDGKK